MPLALTLVGALYTGTERGLVSDLYAARALGVQGWGVCSALVMASQGHVTDVTEVPADTVRAQLEHLALMRDSVALKIGVLGNQQIVEAVFRSAERHPHPIVLEYIVSGPSGETVLTERGIAALNERLSVPDLVLISRQDAELITGGEIQSLDDAQVAAQRLSRLGARRVVVKCGALPTRFFDAVEDPGGDGQSEALASDLYFDGTDFALFEAPYLSGVAVDGAGSAFSVAITVGLAEKRTFEDALQHGKRYVTEALRRATTDRLPFDWVSST